MPLYKYTARNPHNEPVKGKVEARTEAQAAAALRSRGLLVIRLDELNNDSLAFISSALFGIKKNDVVTLTRQLSTMITAGLPLTQAFSILSQQSKPALARVVSELQREVEGGNSFAKALEKHPKVFSKIYVQLVRAGEVGGVVDDVLQRLADNMEKDKEFRAKTRGALIYPAIVLVAMISVAVIMMIFVVPKLLEMYADFDAELPAATLALIAISEFFVQFWWLLAAAAVGGGFLFRRWIKTTAGRRSFDKFMLRIPIMGDLRAKITLTEFARTLSLLLGAGISLLKALEIVGDASENVLYKEAIQDAAKQVEKGVSLSEALSHTEVFPPILIQMIAVGEETGKLDEVLRKLSVYFESESEHAVKNLTTAIEPMIMIVMGIGVGFMVIAIIMPIYNLTSQF